MWTDAEIRAMHEDILGRMLDAGWVQRFSFTDNKGLDIVWTTKGAVNIVKINHWAKLLTADNPDDPRVLAVPLAQGRRFRMGGRPGDINDALKVYVRAGLASSFRLDADGVTMQWTPDGLAFCDGFLSACSELDILKNSDLVLILFVIADDMDAGDIRLVTR